MDVLAGDEEGGALFGADEVEQDQQEATAPPSRGSAPVTVHDVRARPVQHELDPYSTGRVHDTRE